MYLRCILRRNAIAVEADVGHRLSVDITGFGGDPAQGNIKCEEVPTGKQAPHGFVACVGESGGSSNFGMALVNAQVRRGVGAG